MIPAANVRDRGDRDSVAYFENQSVADMTVFDERDLIKVDYDEYRADSTRNVRDDDDNDSVDYHMRYDKDLDNDARYHVETTELEYTKDGDERKPENR